MPTVFLSHSSTDRAFVERRLVPLLHAHGIGTWYSERDIPSASLWDECILTALQRCDWFLIVLSLRAVASKWVKAEVAWAMSNRQNRIASVLFEDCTAETLHLMLPRIQHVDFRTPSDDEARRLLATWGAEFASGSGGMTSSAPGQEGDQLPIPVRLRQVLNSDPHLTAVVQAALESSRNLLPAEGPFFFPQVTDHGRPHLTRFLRLLDWSIAEDAAATLTPSDVVVVVLAALCEEVAIFLAPDDLAALVQIRGTPRVPALDKRPWLSCWHDFLAEQYHGTQEQPNGVPGLGPAALRGAVAELKTGIPPAPSEPQRVLLAEFIRQHRARLAHESLLSQVANISGSPDLRKLVDLVGLLLRRDQFSPRQTLGLLERLHHGRRRLYGSHPLFLLGALRIASVLDCHLHLTDSLHPAIKVVRPFGATRDWSAHSALVDIRYVPDVDPERLEIHAEPVNASEYQTILSWVAWLQAEVDQSWSLLGEVFGAPTLGSFGYRLRRVWSPLEDAGQFAQDQGLPFSPTPARFKTSGPQILRLLARPLYGDRPEIGIRELMQNAIDAVAERHAYYGSASVGRRTAFGEDLPNPLLAELDADVAMVVFRRGNLAQSLTFDVPADWECWLEVADAGVGMTEHTIREYFLNAGASFRRSLEWLQKFDRDDIKVLRSGRFGIGVLATFLLGSEVQVFTRHVDDPDHGWTFHAQLDDHAIELRSVPCPAGTIVRVRIDPALADRLAKKEDHYGGISWDWFCFAQPRVVRACILDDSIQRLAQKITIDDAPDSPFPWRSFEAPQYGRVLWCPGHLVQSYSHQVVVNGIRSVAEQRRDGRLLPGGGPFGAVLLSINDRRGTLPLVLTRDKLEGALPFHAEFVRELWLDHVAWILWSAGTFSEGGTPLDSVLDTSASFNSQGDGSVERRPFLVTATGLVPATRWHALNAGLDRVFIVVHCPNVRRTGATRSLEGPSVSRFLPRLDLEVRPFGGFGHESVQAIVLDEIITVAADFSPQPRHGESPSWWRMLAPHDCFDLEDRQVRASFKEGRKYLPPASYPWVRSFPENYWFVYDPRPSEAAPSLLVEAAPTMPPGAEMPPFCAIVEVDTEPEVAAAVGDYAQIWQELGLPAVIPFDREAQRAVCSSALRELAPHLRALAKEALNRDGTRVAPWWE